MRTSSFTLLDQPFRYYLRRHPRAFVIGMLSLFCTNALDVLAPLSLKLGIDAITSKNLSGLRNAILLYIAFMCGIMLFRFSWRYSFGKFHHGVAEDLRNQIFDKLTSLGPSFYQRSPVGQLMSLLTNDVNSFRMAIGPGLIVLLDGVFLVGMVLPVMIWLSWSWTWKTLILIPIVPFIMRHLEKLVHERYRVQQDRLSDVSGRAQEIVSGIRVIKGFAQEENQRNSFNLLSRTYEDACNEVARADAAFHPLMESAIAVGGVTLLWWCSPDVARGTVTLGSFVMFHEYIKKMMWPMTAIGVGISMVEQGRASFDRIRDLLSTETDIPDHGTVNLGEFERLEINALSFRYPGANSDALKNIQLTINRGETIGIVGPVGSGKTTLLQLICRLYPTSPGMISVNGFSLEQIRRASLMSTLSFVTQDTFLFSDTVAENMALGLQDFPGLETVQETARAVNIDTEIREIPGNYHAYLGERGVNLSGGQKQRLSIARAMIRRASLLMLDDSLSAVDGKTEKAITKELRAHKGRHTVIIVSHRLATLKHADRIVVMNRGHIEAVGHHDVLLKESATYRHLHELQTAQQYGFTEGDAP